MWNLIGDIGGTNMRFAALREGNIVAQETYQTDGGATFAEALDRFSDGLGSRPDRGVVAAAGPVLNGVVTLTNSGLEISETVLSAHTHTGRACVLNDFAAAAWSLVSIREGDLTTLQGSFSDAPAPRLILGPGTGLGVAGLVWQGDRPVVVAGEGGHVRVSPISDRETEIYRAYAKRFPKFAFGDSPVLEAEAILSGRGVPNLYAAITGVDVVPAGAEIFAAARAGADPAAVEAIEIFVRGLGEIAGDLSLVFNATGGVFICGGVAAKNTWLFDKPDFLNAFREGARFTGLRKSYPVHLVPSGSFGIEGGRNYLAHTA